ncbi:FAD-binding-3 domain-containing protein [Mycena venus]|uniref:FAD-binding-3 domain-containing protein n=1 Tax=Mycena venus TaxID=2733690 RepID=A0A8H6Y6C4_9AGAR|nr:FAD-binding-3 domain-containing protein [Mycena venus]
MESAPLSLRFIIVGGSISGLACGYVLRRAGHEVVILEKSDGKTKTGGSIRSPPNMTRILNEWPGMDTLLRSRGTKCSGYGFRRADTLERVGFMQFHEQIMSELQADFLVVQHNDLCDQLTSLCLGAGAVIKYGSKVVDVKTAGGSATVSLEDGSSLSCDIVVGADGHNSIVRAIMAEDAEEDLESTHTVPGINISVPTKVIEQDPEFSLMCDYNELSIWMGSGSSVVGTRDKNAETFNFSICSLASLDIDWDESHEKKIPLPFDLSGYDPRLRKLIGLASACYPTVHQLYVQDDVVGLDGTAVLVGDAAHSALIHGSHNSAMAIEDAATLGRLFSRLSHRKQISMLLNAYQEIRHSRTSATQDSEYQALVEISIPSGPIQEGRDTALKASLTMDFEDFQNAAGSNNMLVQIWEQYLVLFAYNAIEAVDDWWSMWGSMIDELALDELADNM